MGILNLFKKEKTETETFYEEKEKEKRQWETMNPQYSHDNFRIVVQDVFMITGRGTVIVGEIESGSVSAGEEVILRRQDGTSQNVVVVGIEMFRKKLETAHQGDHVGLLLRDLKKKEIHRGDILEK